MSHEHHDVSYLWQLDSLFNRLLWPQQIKHQLCIMAFCGFTTQRDSNAKSVSMSWCYVPPLSIFVPIQSTVCCFFMCLVNIILYLTFTVLSAPVEPVGLDFNTRVWLTHWGRVTHIWVSKQTIIGSDNGLSPGRRQAIIWIDAGILLIGTLGTNFSEILMEIRIFSFKKMGLNMSSAKWRRFCLGLNELITFHTWCSSGM